MSLQIIYFNIKKYIIDYLIEMSIRLILITNKNPHTTKYMVIWVLSGIAKKISTQFI
jgi:hypothetical protein